MLQRKLVSTFECRVGIGCGNKPNRLYPPWAKAFQVEAGVAMARLERVARDERPRDPTISSRANCACAVNSACGVQCFIPLVSPGWPETMDMEFA